ncbi:MAG: hypothetical protein F6K22_05120 [Okeania sp. SIO2F4]|uniref:hypothetical protein n=1 Tax=Okeania sp. SIO2F4 TaxID=2607790 RepID=UPI00142AE5D3|nr:hypothetical protein [Okeania sp. SIO2F4]NES02272.1 hypothetical protein [Okeania sp. SIO2F4]
MNLQDIINSLEILSQEERSILFEILRDRQKQKNQDFMVRSLRGKYSHIATSSYEFALIKQK